VSSAHTERSGRWPLAFGADVVALVVFAALGRRSHDQGGDPVLGALEVAAPFVIALTIGWITTRAWRDPWSLGTGVSLWAIALVGGMVLRRIVFERGTATSFVVVAALVTAALLIGWRLLARRSTRRAVT
jgi:hypothetical protein